MINNLNGRYSPRTMTSFIGNYPLTVSQLQTLNKDLWSTGFVEKFLYSILGNPIDSILSLRWFYGLKNAIPLTALDAYVCIGNVAFDGGFGSASTIVTKPVKQDFVHFDCGELTLSRNNDFTDLPPYRELQIYLPYVGYVRLDGRQIFSQPEPKVRLAYNINLHTGAAVATVYGVVRRGLGSDWKPIIEINCNVGVEVPFNIQAHESILSRMATAASSAAAMGIGGIAGPGGAIAGAIASNVGMPSGEGSRSGGFDAETGSLGYLNPYILEINVVQPYLSLPQGRPDYRNDLFKNIVKTVTFPDAIYDRFIKVRRVKRTDISGAVAKPAWDEIERLLKEGVYYD